MSNDLNTYAAQKRPKHKIGSSSIEMFVLRPRFIFKIAV